MSANGMDKIRRNGWLWIVLFWVVGSGLYGCGSWIKAQPIGNKPVVSAGENEVRPGAKQELPKPGDGRSADHEMWEEGMRAFREKDYSKAMGIFEVLSENVVSDDLSRKALYAVASTELILARTPGEFDAAMAVWRCWSQRMPVEIEKEDPRMMTPFFEQLSLPATVPETKIPKGKKEKKHLVYYNSLLECRGLLQSKEKELQRIKARLDSREREVRRLKHQIESLEEIHLKFQERKQEVSSP